MSTSSAPLVSVLISTHDDARFLPPAIESVLRQTFGDLELIVVDDGSSDQTPELLAEIADPRLVVLTNERKLGLAASLNRALERARGKFCARLDADDVAMPERLERQLARMRAEPPVGVLGTAVLDIDAGGRPGPLRRMAVGTRAVRWHALFSAPVLHPTILFDRELFAACGLRYDESYGESEDYELVTRVLGHADADNLGEPLVLKRGHPGQATMRRGELQSSLARGVALREIERLAPQLEGAELAWKLGRGQTPADLPRAVRAFRELLAAFERRYGTDAAVRAAAARELVRGGRPLDGLRIAPTLPARIAVDRGQRVAQTRSARLSVLLGLFAMLVVIRAIFVARRNITLAQRGRLPRNGPWPPH